MATNKKSVLLYCDIIHTVKELSDEEAGKLFKHYLDYINDLNPVAPDKLTQIVFEPMKQNLKRDLKKWSEKSERNKNIALEAWSKRTNANAYKSIPNAADKDTVIVTDTVKDNVTDIYLKVKEQIFKISVSEYIKTYLQIWLDNENRVNTKPVVEMALKEIDIKYFGYSFRDENHICKSFQLICKNLKTEVKTQGTGGKKF